MIGGTEGRQLDARQGAVGWHLHTAGVARQTESAMYQRILVPVDGSLTSISGLDKAIQLAKLTEKGRAPRMMDVCVEP